MNHQIWKHHCAITVNSWHLLPRNFKLKIICQLCYIPMTSHNEHSVSREEVYLDRGSLTWWLTNSSDIYFFIKRDLKSVLSNCQGLIKDTKSTRGRPDRNVAPCSRPITTVIGPLHECKKVCPCTKALPPSGSRAWIKKGRKKRKKRGRETGKTEARRLMERKAAQQNKTHRRN